MRGFWKFKLLLEDASGYYSHVTTVVCHDCHMNSSSTVFLEELGGVITAIRDRLRGISSCSWKSPNFSYMHKSLLFSFLICFKIAKNIII